MLTQGQAIEFIEKCFGQAILTNGGLNAAVVCPHCAEKTDNLEKKKLVIRTDNFICHCWVCNYRSGNLVNLLSTFHPHFIEEYREKFKLKQSYKHCGVIDFSDLFDDNKQQIVKTPEIQLPHGFTLIANNLGKNNKSVDEAWAYLKGRGLSVSDLWLWKFGITEYKPPKGEPNYRFRVIVPSFNCSGAVNYFSARAYWKSISGPKYTNPHIPRETIVFNELNIDWSEELTIAEGVFDLVKCNENATCLLGSTLDESYILFQKIVEHNTPVLLALDNDAKNKTLSLANLLTEYGVKVRIFQVPEKMNDVGEMTKSQFIENARNAMLFTKQDLLRFKLGVL